MDRGRFGCLPPFPCRIPGVSRPFGGAAPRRFDWLALTDGSIASHGLPDRCAVRARSRSWPVARAGAVQPVRGVVRHAAAAARRGAERPARPAAAIRSVPGRSLS